MNSSAEPSHFMRKIQKISAVIIALLIGLTVYGLLETYQSTGNGVLHRKKTLSEEVRRTNALVDQSPLKTAQELAQLPAIPEEHPMVQEALRLADYEVDL